MPVVAGDVRLFGAPLGPAPAPCLDRDRVRAAAAAAPPPASRRPRYEVVTSGLLHGRALRPPRGTSARALAALGRRRPGRPGAPAGAGAVRRPAAARAHRPRPGPRARPAGPRRADLRRRHRRRRRRSSTPSAACTTRGPPCVVILHELGAVRAADRPRASCCGTAGSRTTAPRPAPAASTPAQWHDHTHAHPDPEPPTHRSVAVRGGEPVTAWDQVRRAAQLARSCSARCIAALLVGAAAPVVGTFLVQRRMALLGDGIGHVALTGVALGWLVGSWAGAGAADALAVPGRRDRRGRRLDRHRAGARARPDQRRPRPRAHVLRRHRGRRPAHQARRRHQRQPHQLPVRLDLDRVRPPTCGGPSRWPSLVLGVGVGLRTALFAVSHDEEFARASGLPVRLLSMLVATIAALTVTIAMRVVGLLLVSALMIVPVAIAQLVAPLVQPHHDAGQRDRRRRQRRPGWSHLLARHPARRHDRRPGDPRVRGRRHRCSRSCAGRAPPQDPHPDMVDDVLLVDDVDDADGVAVRRPSPTT